MAPKQASVGYEGGSPSSKRDRTPQPAPVRFYIPLNVVLLFLVASHTISVLYAPILDCDETYNYWEPLHYLTHGYGLQTWEYSPEFAIRSWAYIGLHALPAKVIGTMTSKTALFYSIRILLGVISAATETRLYSAISKSLNPRIAVLYFLIILTSPGIFHASTALLPSSFTMYCSTLGLTSFLTNPRRTASGIMWFGIGAMLGWPFAGALIIPFVLEDCIAAIIMEDVLDTFRLYLDGIVRCLVVLALQVSIDTFFYRQFVIVPWRIVSYNVFGGQDRGPDIFGTEPWHFYARNLLLNFNLWSMLSIATLPLLALQTIFLRTQTTKQTILRTVVLSLPFYLWLTIFTIQPHKEERFMYPAYPFLALNASISLHMLLSWLGQSKPTAVIGRIPPQLKLAFILPVIFASLLISILRIAGTVTAYSAPLNIYTHLPINTTATNICLGKDWYRFPTSFHLPTPLHAKFIRSEFNGLLPGQFSEATSPGFFPGAHLIPSGMNDLNQFDTGKVIDIKHCQYLVDSYFSYLEPTELEPLYVQDGKTWEKIHCSPFLNASATSFLARTLYIPEWSIIPSRFRRKWGEHCLLRRRT